jgi:sec-independent protein translocase protein TatB
MFEVGFTELLLISALALLVLGPQKLPKLAQQIGRWIGRARAMARQFRDQLEEEAHTLETKMKVDPGIDTSLEPAKPAAATSATPATPAAPAAPPAPAQPYAATYPDPPEEEFYPPDHHMHPSNRAAAETGAAPAGDAAPPHGEGAQGELDLTTDRDPPRTP